MLSEWVKAESHYCRLHIGKAGYATARAGDERPMQKLTMAGPRALAQHNAGVAASAGLQGLRGSGGAPCLSCCPCKDTFLRSWLHEVLGKDPWCLVSQETSSLTGYSDHQVKVGGLRPRFVLREGGDTVNKPNCRQNHSVSLERISRNAVP